MVQSGLSLVGPAPFTVPVSRRKPPSLQQQLRAQLHALVDEVGVGGRLPAERDLADQWGVARMTLRRAIDSLVADGVLRRRHGSGTFVTPRPRVRALGLTSFHSDMAARGLVPGTEVLNFRRVPASPGLAAQLNLGVDAPVFHFTRLRLGSGEPVAVETTWIAEELVPGLSPNDLKSSLYAVLADRYDVRVGQARVTIDPVLPDRRTRDLLRIGADQACLRFRMVDFDERGRVLMLAHCVYRGDQYQLTADITGGGMGSERAVGGLSGSTLP